METHGPLHLAAFAGKADRQACGLHIQPRLRDRHLANGAGAQNRAGEGSERVDVDIRGGDEDDQPETVVQDRAIAASLPCMVASTACRPA